MAMLPFCGYTMADYWTHWISIGKRQGVKLPKIYYVNWFRKSSDGKYVWPGFGENSRVLQWIFERCEGRSEAIETPIGNLPTRDALNFDGLGLSEETIAELLRVEVDGWLAEIPLIEEYYDKFGDRLPVELSEELAILKSNLEKAR